MVVSYTELARARGLTARLLEELQLGGYLFELEAFEDDWQLRVDCAAEGGWASMRLPVDRQRLLACDEDRAAAEQVLAEWRRQLSACKLQDAPR